MRIILMTACLLSSFPLYSQSSFPYTPPAGFSILDKAAGDFNADGHTDYIVVLRNELDSLNPDTTRPLLILMGADNGKLVLFKRNDHVVFCKNCGGIWGDPYEGITVKGRYFSIDHYGGSAWRWTRNITFRYDPARKDFILHRDGGESFHATDPEKAEKFLKRKNLYGKQRFEEYDNSQE